MGWVNQGRGKTQKLGKVFQKQTIAIDLTGIAQKILHQTLTLSKCLIQQR